MNMFVNKEYSSLLHSSKKFYQTICWFIVSSLALEYAAFLFEEVVEPISDCIGLDATSSAKKHSEASAKKLEISMLFSP